MAYRLLIDGELINGVSELDVINPATGAVVERCARADKAQLDQAVAAARAAFPAWAALSFGERRARLETLADALSSRGDELARLLTLEQGKPLPQAAAEIATAVRAMRAYAAMSISPRVLRDNATERIVEERLPLGVVAAIVPWNFPLSMIAIKIAPALITGNTVVAKPAPTTPLSALLLGEIAAPILPRGVLNIIVDDNDLGTALSSHAEVAKVAFTGSTETGRKVMRDGAPTLKRITLELGGNDAAIVLGDVDVPTVAATIFNYAIFNAGQVCIAPKRIYVHNSIYRSFCEALVERAKATVIDDGLTPGTTLGPLQNRRQFEKVSAYLAGAPRYGTVIAGGEPLDRPGYFIPPTIVRDVAEEAPLVREEQFGPVLPVMSFDTIDDVIARANATPFGLAGSVWTTDIAAGLAIASRIEAGTVWVNKCLDVPFDIPFRGAKQSGIGTESGLAGLEEYTQARILNVSFAPV